MTKTLGLKSLNLAVAGLCLTRPGITTAEQKPAGAEAWKQTATFACLKGVLPPAGLAVAAPAPQT